MVSDWVTIGRPKKRHIGEKSRLLRALHADHESTMSLISPIQQQNKTSSPEFACYNDPRAVYLGAPMLTLRLSLKLCSRRGTQSAECQSRLWVENLRILSPRGWRNRLVAWHSEADYLHRDLMISGALSDRVSIASLAKALSRAKDISSRPLRQRHLLGYCRGLKAEYAKKVLQRAIRPCRWSLSQSSRRMSYTPASTTSPTQVSVVSQPSMKIVELALLQLLSKV
jgi:hypothetical protein